MIARGVPQLRTRYQMTVEIPDVDQGDLSVTRSESQW